MTCSSPLLSQSRRQSLREGGLNLTPRCMPLTMTNSSICRKIKMRIAAAGATSSGTLVDVRLSKTRDMAAARAFFRSAKSVTGITPARVTTDGHDSYPRAIDTEFGGHVRRRTSQYLNNRIEQDHRPIKGRYRPMCGFKDSSSAGRFCRSFDELRNFLRPRSNRNQHVPASHRCLHILSRSLTVISILTAAAMCRSRWIFEPARRFRRHAIGSADVADG